MRSTNRKRVLLVSAAVILLCMTIVVGMTWALFTDTKGVANHLRAGDLSITLKRTELTKKMLDTSGYLVENKVQTTANEALNFTEETEENVFGIQPGEKVVPGSKYVATMQIENLSDVAFGYWVEIVCTDQTKGEHLANQLKITVNANESYVAKGLTVGGENAYIDVLEKGKSGTFTVSVEFEDKGFHYEDRVLGSDNDAAKGENLSFDLVVYAVQVTTAPTP